MGDTRFRGRVGVVAVMMTAALFVGTGTASLAQAPTGPLAGWTNLRAAYHAAGDGRTDDTGALQRALDELGQEKRSHVLYLPAGTYRITRGLAMTSQMDVAVQGEDPSRTTIRWDGPLGGVMLTCNGVRYSRFGGITWNGARRASCAVMHGWDGKTAGASTHNEHSDERFVDLGFGIRGGSGGYMDAECPITRCIFTRCTSAGVSIESFNALDWWIWNCRFEDCAVGVTNDPGAGHFHVYDSLFLRSVEADLKIGNTSYFSFRRNTSIGSGMFLKAGWIGAGAPTTVQGNRVINPRGPAIQVGNVGPLLLLDNTFRVTASPTVVANCDVVSVGNTFTAAKPLAARRVVAAIGDRVVAPARIVVPHTAQLPAVPVRRAQVVELPAGCKAAAIQSAISRVGAAPVVIHLPFGAYSIDRSLLIPAGRPVRIVGDGYGTVLRWSGKGAGPVVRLAGPSRASLSNLTVEGGGVARAITVEGCDQPQARVTMDQGEVAGASSAGLLVDGLARCDVTLANFEHSGCKGVAVKVVGAGKRPAGLPTGGRVCIFGGASSNNELSYDVSRWGSLMAQDIWYEGSPPGFIDLADTGTFTLNGAEIACADPNHGGKEEGVPAIRIAGFRGRVTILTSILSTRLRVTGGGPETCVLALGLQGSGDTFFGTNAPGARAALVAGLKYLPGGGATGVPDSGSYDAAFLQTMLEQVRSQAPRSLDPLPAGVTDVRFHRVVASNATVGIHLRP